MLFIKQTSLGWGDIFTSAIRVHGGGWHLVSEELEEEVLRLMPFIIPTIEDDVIVAVTDNLEGRYNFAKPQPEPQPPPDEDRDAMLMDQEYRLTMLELGLN